MKVFLDTSVLVAASVQSHPHHMRALPLLQRVAAKDDAGYISAHSVAETYAVLTRLPLKPAIHPLEAGRILRDNILQHFNLVPLAPEDYVTALADMGENGWIGAKIYDVLLLRSAAKSKAERIYTFNIGEFRKLAPSALRPNISAP